MASPLTETSKNFGWQRRSTNQNKAGAQRVKVACKYETKSSGIFAMTELIYLA